MDRRVLVIELNHIKRRLKMGKFSIERTNKNGTYALIGEYETFDLALEALKTIKSKLRHEISSPEWVNTHLGYLPMASIN